jgi:hypothetical protein
MTKMAVREAFDTAHGRVLVMEEPSTGAAHIVAAAMDEYPHTPVVLTGHFLAMQSLFDADPELAARFAHRIEFEDHTPEQLWQHVEEIAGRDGYRIDHAAREQFLSLVEPLCAGDVWPRPIDAIGNLRFAARVPDAARRFADQRLCAVADLSALGDDELMLLTAEDIAAAVRQLAGADRDGSEPSSA